MSLAKQSTATSILVGPILDADGAAKTDEVVGNIRVAKNGTVGTPNAGSTLTHSHTGHYVYAAHAGDLDTLGEVTISLNSGTNAMAPVSVQVVPAAVYDAMIAGTGKLLAGPGGTACTVHLETADAVPIADVDVWISTDAAGDNVIAGPLQTGADGDTKIPFMLDPGNYYAWRQKSGVNFDNPQELTVS